MANVHLGRPDVGTIHGTATRAVQIRNQIIKSGFTDVDSVSFTFNEVLVEVSRADTANTAVAQYFDKREGALR